jgi:hypothetical protein
MSYEPTQPMQPPSTASTAQVDAAQDSVDSGGVDTDTVTDRPGASGSDDVAQESPREVGSGPGSAPEGGVAHATVPRAVLSKDGIPAPPDNAPQGGPSQGDDSQGDGPQGDAAPADEPQRDAATADAAAADAVAAGGAGADGAGVDEPQSHQTHSGGPQSDSTPADGPQSGWAPADGPQGGWAPADRPQSGWAPDDGPHGDRAPADGPQGDWGQGNGPQGYGQQGHGPQGHGQQGSWDQANWDQGYGPQDQGAQNDWDQGYRHQGQGYGPQDYGPPDGPPVKRRRRRRPVRWSVISLFVLLVLAIVLVIGNFVGQAIAENDMANQFTANGFPVKPSVDIEGFPFLTQVVHKDFKKVVISASNIPAGPVTISSLNATITGMHLNSSWNGATIDRLTATAFVSLSSLTGGISNELGDAASLTAVPDGPNKLKVTGTVLGGLSASGVVEFKQTGPQQITVELPTVGGLVGTLLGSAPSFTINLPAGVPPSLRITGLTLNGQGLTLSAAATDATFSQ